MSAPSLKNEIAVVGELNVDLVAAGLSGPPVLGQEMLADDLELTLGSASAIFACGASRLGRGVTFVSRVGSDYFGQFCVQELAGRGVSTAFVEVAEASKTGVTIVLSTPQDRALVTHLGAIAELGFADIPLDALGGHRHLHVTSYFLQAALRPEFPRLMDEARSRGLTVSFDPNSDPSQSWDPEIFRVFEKADIVFVNESEAVHLTSETDLRRAAGRLAEHCECVVVKRGPAGAVAIRNGEFAAADGFEVKAVDTVGAGDTFDAGFVHAFLDGLSLSECLIAGNACGALSVTRPGGTTAQPDAQQLADFLSLHRASTGAGNFN